MNSPSGVKTISELLQSNLANNFFRDFGKITVCSMYACMYGFFFGVKWKLNYYQLNEQKGNLSKRRPGIEHLGKPISSKQNVGWATEWASRQVSKNIRWKKFDSRTGALEFTWLKGEYHEQVIVWLRCSVTPDWNGFRKHLKASRLIKPRDFMSSFQE